MNYIPYDSAVEREQVTYDESLRVFMLQVYNYMTVALALSGATALGVYMIPELSAAILALARLVNP